MRRYRSRRVPVTVPIEIQTSLKRPPMSVSTKDLSVSGAFVETELSFSVGEILACTFSLPTREKPFTLFGEVARIADPEQSIPCQTCGMGLRFIDSTTMERQQIRTYVNSFDVSQEVSENSWFK